MVSLTMFECYMLMLQDFHIFHLTLEYSFTFLLIV